MDGTPTILARVAKTRSMTTGYAMATGSYGRRQFFMLGLVAAAGAPATAWAFQIQEMSPSAARAYMTACEAPALHARLLAEVDAQLAGRSLSADEIQRVKSETRCPFCGCPLGAPASSSGDLPF